MRIISLAPSVTSILLALGAGKELIAVTRWCKDVADIASRPQVGDCWKLDINEAMRLKPTMLIGSIPFAQETVADILKQSVAFLALNPRSLADIYENIRSLGQLAGKSKRADQLIRKMKREFAASAKSAPFLPRRSKPRVYCEAWPNPRISSPPWVAELVELAGGKFVAPPGQRIDDEIVARAKPDIIILAWAAAGDRAKPQSALRNPHWKNVPAVKSGRVVVIRDELLNTPGPPLMRGARELLRAIHPDSASAK